MTAFALLYKGDMIYSSGNWYMQVDYEVETVEICELAQRITWRVCIIYVTRELNFSLPKGKIQQRQQPNCKLPYFADSWSQSCWEYPVSNETYPSNVSIRSYLKYILGIRLSVYRDSTIVTQSPGWQCSCSTPHRGRTPPKTSWGFFNVNTIKWCFLWLGLYFLNKAG